VADLVEQLYALTTCNVQELTGIAKNPKQNPHPAKPEPLHGDRLTCGSNPWLYARQVTDLDVKQLASGFEEVSWKEPDHFRMKQDSSGLELERKGSRETITRVVRGPLSFEPVWDRAAARRKVQFAREAE
jgi:hypothetical protein